MPRPAYSDEQNETVRQDLLKGAVELLRETGPEELSLRRLAKRMGISHTKVYNYFDSKDSLLTSIQIEALHALRSKIHANDPSDEAPMVRLRAASYALYDFATGSPDEYVFLFGTTHRSTAHSDELLELRHETFNDIVVMSKLANKNGDTKMDGRTLANLAWAMLHGLFMLNFQGQLIEGRSFDDLFEEALDQMYGRASKA